MKTVKELVDEVHDEKNAIKAVDMGLGGLEAFALEASNELKIGGDGAQAALDNLVHLVGALRKAVPANVIPATAGPVGKSPHEQYLEQAATIVQEHLAKMQEVVKGVQGTLEGVTAALQHLNTATATIKSPDLKKVAA